jgi:hypothetical protein
MNTLRIKQNILVKVIVTEKFKEDYKKELTKQIEAAESKAKELKSSLAKLVIESAGIRNASYVESLKTRIEEERMLQEALMGELKEKAKEIDILEIGAIFSYTMLEGNMEIKEGDNLWQKVTGAEIVIKDNIIISIKES